MTSQHAKKVRLDNNIGDDIVELRVSDTIRIHFGKTSVPVSPEFVHQNFGQGGKILWLQQFMPLAIDIYVDTEADLQSKAVVSFGGDQTSPIAADLCRGIVAKLATPCDLAEGCKPAVYPGDLSGKISSSSSNSISPVLCETLPSGHIVEKYSSSEFGGKPLEVWRRAEWLMLWYIESVSQSDHITDKFWDYYLLRDSNGEIVTMCSIYKFPSFMFLDKGFIGERIRLSQFLTIPSKRNGGHGSVLLRFLVEKVIANDEVDMFTMEDPSFGMTSMRESVYLRLAKEEGLFDRKDIPVEDIEDTLKIPRIFAKRIKNLIEIDHLRSSNTISEGVVDRVISSGNEFVMKFINSIEFFDEEELEGKEAKPLSDEARGQLIRNKVHEALLKLEKVGA